MQVCHHNPRRLTCRVDGPFLDRDILGGAYRDVYVIFVDVYRGRVLRNIGIIETKTGHSSRSATAEGGEDSCRRLATIFSPSVTTFGQSIQCSGWRLIKRPKVVCPMNSNRSNIIPTDR